MGAHTPGPWVIGSKLHGFDFSIVNPKGDAELGNWLIAGARWDANARLIAAAPELLEALLAAVEFAEQDYHALTPIGEAMLAGWRAAIAKAEGRT